MNMNFMNALVGEFSWRRLLRSAFLIPFGVYLGLQFVLYFYADELIFQPPRASYGDSFDITELTVGNGETISLYSRPNATANQTVLYIHGNAEDLGTIKPALDHLHALGMSVAAFDYRGYGMSSGTPSEANSYEDADAAYQHLVAELKIDPKNIIVFGRSLGGAVAIDLASRRPVGGLIVESSFVSAFRVVTGYPIFPYDRFESAAKIASVRCPVLVIHGTSDEVIPIWHGKALFDETVSPKYAYWVEGAGHNNVMLRGGADYDTTLRAFFRFLVK